ncbi:MAG TPA: cyclopropane-fatty-acyl-phospholipid synthase family protein [Actinospica sp.]|nr:cyclopropane-fatty-acyl-phospholipid synthase family protein [Actinospica sp.]
MPSRNPDPVAPRLARLYQDLTEGRDLPVGVQAWDASHAGPMEDPTIFISSPRALRRLLWAPNELGLAQAYVTGELDVDGDIAEGLRRVWAGVGADVRPPRIARPANIARLLATAVRFRAVGPRPAPPASQARVRGGLHSLARDRAVIAHHYDLSNDFYALLLDGSMAYSSAYWPSDEPGCTLAEAQRAKLDLICRKLELSPGMRLLDVGCGWGGLLMHAAEHYGVRGTGLTLSKEQAAFIAGELERRGLVGLVEVRVEHFREFHAPRAFDAVASIEMGEHVGAEAYPVYTRTVHTSLKAGGRALIQQMSRAKDAAPGGGPFIESFIAPDMHMRPLPDTVSLWRAAGFGLLDTESLREHYARTVEAWRANLEDAWAKAVELVGEETARVWRLYLAGGQLAFEQGRMGVDQIVLVKPEAGKR